MKFWQVVLLSVGVANVTFADLDEERVKKAFESLLKQQEALSAEIQKMKAVLGLSSILDEVGYWDKTDDLSKETAKLTDKAIELAGEQKLREAKEVFQEAWEKSPEAALTNFNLGLIYAHLHQDTLAKKFFKQAVESKEKVPDKNIVLSYLRGEESVTKVISDPFEKQKTDLANTKKEIDSYMRSQAMSAPEKMRLTIETLKEFMEIAKQDDSLIQENYLYVADVFSTFELYADAVQALDQYEKAMQGEELPENFFSKRLELKKRFEEQNELREKIWAREVDPNVRFQLEDSITELKVFASQMQEFVKKTTPEDPDFNMVCERLKEFNWGNKPNRHVLVLSRYQEVLFSSLPGTLPIDRYQDVQGVPFFREITKTPPSEIGFKEVKTMTVDLNINGRVVPYIVLYTYIPKHDAFIVVRLNESQMM